MMLGVVELLSSPLLSLVVLYSEPYHPYTSSVILYRYRVNDQLISIVPQRISKFDLQ